MARVVDAGALLTAFGAEQLLEHVRIADSFAAWNNIGAQDAPEMTAAQLAQYVHRGVFLHKLNAVSTKQQYNIEDKVFSLRQACIFEEY
jgi:hypothetical protein